MRILIHDFGGYPFPIELSRELAARGHEVIHAFCGSIKTTPTGELTARSNDPDTLLIDRLELSEPLNKYSFVKRWRQEHQFGRMIAEAVRRHRPDVVVSGNTPLDAQRILQKQCESMKIPFVFWLQDILGIATEAVLRRKLPVIGKWIGRYYLRMEKRMLRMSDLVIVITEDFEPLMKDWGVESSRTMVLENWAPLANLVPRSKQNPWSTQHQLDDKLCFLYAGTMGMKHNPDLLLELAKRFRDREDVVVLVVSCGMGADYLRENAKEHHLPNLRVMDFQPFEQVPDVMGTADVLVAVLEPDAGVFSVPSKVLAYLCAGKALLLAVPPENLAARIVAKNQAGLVGPPENIETFIDSALQLVDDSPRRESMGRSARKYAEKNFDIIKIANRMESRLQDVVSSRSQPDERNQPNQA